MEEGPSAVVGEVGGDVCERETAEWVGDGKKALEMEPDEEELVAGEPTTIPAVATVVSSWLGLRWATGCM